MLKGSLTETDITRTKARNEAKYEIMHQFVIARAIRHWEKNIKESPSSSLDVFRSGVDAFVEHIALTEQLVFKSMCSANS